MVSVVTDCVHNFVHCTPEDASEKEMSVMVDSFVTVTDGDQFPVRTGSVGEPLLGYHPIIVSPYESYPGLNVIPRYALDMNPGAICK